MAELEKTFEAAFASEALLSLQKWWGSNMRPPLTDYNISPAFYKRVEPEARSPYPSLVRCKVRAKDPQQHWNTHYIEIELTEGAKYLVSRWTKDG